MGEAGSKFSGGQKQRLSNCSHSTRKPSIILLDEAMTLDNENEQNYL